MRQGRRGDPEIMSANDEAAPAQVGPGFGMDPRYRLGDRHRIDAGEDVFDEGPPAGSSCSSCSVHTLQQFADRDDADSPLLVAGERFEG